MEQIVRYTDDGRKILVDEDTGQEVGVPTGKPFQWKKNLDSGMGMFGMTEDGLGTEVLSWWQKELQKNRDSEEEGPFKFGSGWWKNFSGRRDERRAERAEKRKTATSILDVENKKDLAEVKEREGGDWGEDDNSLLSMASKNYMERMFENTGESDAYQYDIYGPTLKTGLKYDR